MILDLDGTTIRRSFSRNAVTYESAAQLQFEIGHQLLTQLCQVTIFPHTILDLGTGTGWASVILRQMFPQAHIISIDFALPMLELALKRSPELFCVCANAEYLPLRSKTVDLIYSNAMLQWCNDISLIFNNVQQILIPEGLFAFTTFGPATLNELRDAWARADNYPHVSDFYNLENLRYYLKIAGFTRIELRTELKCLTYANVKELMLNLKTLGANNAAFKRTKGLMGKKRFATMLDAYEQRREKNSLPVTYEIIYGLAWNH
jgi:malonyl-CoA O-methyltransferase